MPALCPILILHHAWRLKHYSFFDIGGSALYSDEPRTLEALNDLSTRCYLPLAETLHHRLRENCGDFRVAIALSGLLIEQLETFRPDVLDAFKRVVDTGFVELLGAPYHHSLAAVYSPQEFSEQAILHRDKVKSVFGQVPETFINTGLVYSDTIAAEVDRLGYHVIVGGTPERLAAKRGSDRLYRPPACTTLRLMPQDHRTPDALMRHVATRSGSAAAPSAPHRAIAMVLDPLDDQGMDTPFVTFVDQLAGTVTPRGKAGFTTPRQAFHTGAPATALAIPEFTAGKGDHTLTPWMGNDMQKDALHALYRIELQIKSRHDPVLLRQWRLLQASDHFLAMNTIGHTRSAPQASPYDVYINFMNILTDLSERVGG